MINKDLLIADKKLLSNKIWFYTKKNYWLLKPNFEIKKNCYLIKLNF